MKKLIRFLIILTIIIILLVIAYRYFLSGKSSYQSIYLVPPDAALIIESDAAFSAWDKIINSQAWYKLKSNKALAEINDDIQSIDSLFANKRLLLKIIGRRKVMLSMHEFHPGRYDYLYIINIGEITQIRKPEKLLSSILGSEYPITKRMYNGKTIYELLDRESGELYIFSFIKGKLVFSNNYVLVEASVDEEKNMSIGRDLNFIDVSKRISGKGLFNIYINYTYFVPYLKSELGKTSEFISKLDEELFFSGFSFNINTEGLISLEGYTTINDSASSFYTSILDGGYGSLQSSSVIPAKVASMVKISFDNVLDYYEQSIDKLGETEREAYKIRKQKIEKKLKISVQENFLSWIDDEIVLLQTQPSNLGRKNEFAVILHTKNKRDPEENLNFLGHQIEKNSPVKIKKVDYEGYIIRYISFPGLLKALLGKMLDKIEKPYYTIIDRYVIFSNHPQTLKNIIDDYLKKNTLENSNEFNNFNKEFGKKNTVYTYFDLPVLFSNLEEFVSPETWMNVKENKPYIVSFPRAGIQIDSEDNILHLLVKAQFSDQIEEYTQPRFDTYSFMKLFSGTVQKSEGEEPEWFDPKIIIHDLDQTKLESRHENGKIKFSVGLKNGLRHGSYKEYYPDGTTRIKGKYRNDKRDGEWRLFDAEGNLIEEKLFSDGKEENQ